VGVTGNPSVWVKCHAVSGQRDPEGGVGAGGDDADPDALSRLCREGGRCTGDSAVDQVVGVGHVAAVTAEQVTLAATPDTGHGAHAGHSVHGAVVAHARGSQPVEDLLGAAADPGGPVIEHDNPFGVVAAGVGGVVDDDR